MDEKELALTLGSFPTGNLCNAHERVQAMTAALNPLSQGLKVSGPAKTAKCRPGQNAAIHQAVHGARPGEVLVVEYEGDRSFGPFGDILASACQIKGIAGLVIDGTVRDSAEIREMGFAVFCRGTNPNTTAKSDPGEVDCDVSCGGLQVRPGDFVIGDDDGVVVVPKEIAQEVATKAAAVVRKEEEIKARLTAGESTWEIFGLGTQN